MPIKAVYLTADAYSVCLTHAMTTEKEEIMGLLIGEISEQMTCHISALIILRRSDKRSDRVEISPEQLSDASSYAENLSHLLQRPMRIVGWYHSHPHITVWPSHLDIRTQASYQLMDDGFIGLIFSVFNHDKVSKINKVQVCCFQSVKNSFGIEDYERLEIPLYIEPVERISDPCLRSLVHLPEILCHEEDDLYHQAKQACGMDLSSAVHNGSVYTKNMVHIQEGLIGPLMQRLEHRLKDNERHLHTLRKEKEKLKAELKHSVLLSPVKSTAV
jgi:BRCA1/BRCA2-containing complex subunit 3